MVAGFYWRLSVEGPSAQAVCCMSVLDTLATGEQDIWADDIDASPTGDCDPCGKDIDPFGYDIDPVVEAPTAGNEAGAATQTAADEPVDLACLLAPDVPLAKKRKRAPKAAAAAACIPLSRLESVRHAAKARWARVRKRPAGHEPPDPPVVQTLAVVPVAERDSAVVNILPPTCALAVAAAIVKPFDPKVKRKREGDLHNRSKNLLSQAALGQQLKMDPKTVQRKLRLMGAFTLLGSRLRAVTTMQTLHYHLKDTFELVEPLLHVTVQAYDEVKVYLRVNEVPKETAEQMKREKLSGIGTKLMQIILGFGCLWRVDGGFLLLEYEQPTLLKPSRSSHAECVHDIVYSQTASPAWIAETFKSRLRVTINDDLPSNGIADAANFSANPTESLLRWVCMAHKGHKCSELLWLVYPSDQRGILNMVQALHVPGAFGDFKTGIMWWLRRRLVVYEEEAGGPGQRANNFRDKVEMSFGAKRDERLAGAKARHRQTTGQARRRLLNGRTYQFLEPEHFCGGEGCCAGRDNTLSQINSTILG